MPRLVNSKDLNTALLNSTRVQKVIREAAEKKLADKKRELIKEFLDHPVSKEIAGGVSATNLSGTLSGYGNLFSFIGFDKNESPIENWVNFLNKKIRIIGNKKQKNLSSNNFIIEFQVSQVSGADYVANAKMPWESGQSWITSIEKGISGFSSFISKKLGRSGGGVQTDNKIRPTEYRRVKYWSTIWSNFVKSLRQ